MVNPKEQESVDERKIEDIVDQSDDDGFTGSSQPVGASSSAVSRGSGESVASGVEVGLTERLTDILVDEGDGDLLLQQSGREDTVLQWLLALDLQVMGACRADERLKPLLKLNVSGGVAEDRLLTHLSQHFEPSEVGMLARCLCVPLVSIRVGRINKRGTLLCPTASRGNLNLTLLPSSDLRVSFVGDDGCTERLCTLCSDVQCSNVVVEEISADESGRSFLIKIPDGKVFYFWCSEKSKLLGNELLSKVKDLLKRKPSLAQLTGISKSRLECFATLLRAYLLGSTVTNHQATGVVSLSSLLDVSLDPSELGQTAQSSSASLKPHRSRHCGSQTAKTSSPYQVSLSPRLSTFKEGSPRILSSLKNVAREKLRRRVDCTLSSVDNPCGAPAITTDALSSDHSDKDNLPQNSANHLFAPLSFLEPSGKPGTLSFPSLESHVPSLGSSFLSPYYCWCPPVVSPLQYTVAPAQLHIPATEALSLPPLPSLLPANRSSSMLTPIPSLNLADCPPLDFPSFLPEPLVRLPLSMPNSQQIATFTPLMCDPIVHIPVIDVCSSGQGYLVSAGPAMSTSIPPLHPKLVSPLISEPDSVLENSARETLRLLISSSNQTNLQLMDVLPSVLSNTDEKPSILVSGSRGLYSGARDVDVIANSFAAMGLVSFSERWGFEAAKRGIHRSTSVDQLEKFTGPGGSCSEDGNPTSELQDGMTD